MKQNQKGFTIIEVMLATVLFSMIALSVIYFISTGTKTSNAAQYQINIQTEAQEVLNQLTGFTMEGNDANTYSIGDNLIFVIEQNDKESKNTKKESIILYRKGEKRLYYYEVIGTASAGTVTTAAEIAQIENELKDDSAAITEGELLGEYIGDFTVTMESDSMITFHIQVVIGEKQFTTEASAKFRSRQVLTTSPLISLP